MIEYQIIYVLLLITFLFAFSYFIYQNAIPPISKCELELQEKNSDWFLLMSFLKYLLYSIIAIILITGLYIALYILSLATFYISASIFEFLPKNIIEYKDCLNAVVQIITLLGSVITASFAYIFKNKKNPNDINPTDEIKKTHDSKKIKIIKKNNVKQKNKVIIVEKKRFKISSTLWILSILYVFIGIFIIFNKINLDPKVLDGITIISIGLAVASFAYTTTQDINNSNKEIDDKLDEIDKKLDTVIKNTHKKRIR